MYKLLHFFFFIRLLSQSNKFLVDFDYEDTVQSLLFLTFLYEYTIDST